jgi:hypothetical protein
MIEYESKIYIILLIFCSMYMCYIIYDEYKLDNAKTIDVSRIHPASI